jgi:hypothetical protein
VDLLEWQLGLLEAHARTAGGGPANARRPARGR